MKPETRNPQLDDNDEIPVPQDAFVQQVDDDSLPARLILIDQQDGRRADGAAALFVP